MFKGACRGWGVGIPMAIPPPSKFLGWSGSTWVHQLVKSLVKGALICNLLQQQLNIERNYSIQIKKSEWVTLNNSNLRLYGMIYINVFFIRVAYVCIQIRFIHYSFSIEKGLMDTAKEFLIFAKYKQKIHSTSKYKNDLITNSKT